MARPLDIAARFLDGKQPVGAPGADLPDASPCVWWSDPPELRAPIWRPVRGECHAPIACSRLGPCAHRHPGQACAHRATAPERPRVPPPLLVTTGGRHAPD